MRSRVQLGPALGVEAQRNWFRLRSNASGAPYRGLPNFQFGNSASASVPHSSMSSSVNVTPLAAFYSAIPITSSAQFLTPRWQISRVQHLKETVVPGPGQNAVRPFDSKIALVAATASAVGGLV